MHIETLGSGPSLVLLHGWALHGGVFAPLVQRLSDRYTLHLVDLPGHGHSRDSEVALTLAGALVQQRGWQPNQLPRVPQVIAASSPVHHHDKAAS